MSLLNELFPGISKISNCVVPEWNDPDSPWSILSNHDDGICSQLSELIGPDGVFIHPSAIIGEFVSIEGPCYIGADVEIRHAAFLRKGSWICERAIVGHSTEIKNSVLLPGSKAPHFNYIGDSIVGFEANLGAGTKLANVRNDGSEILINNRDGLRVKSGLRKLGAMIGDGSKIGCNVVTNPGTIISPGTMISPNESVSGWKV